MYSFLHTRGENGLNAVLMRDKGTCDLVKAEIYEHDLHILDPILNISPVKIAKIEKKSCSFENWQNCRGERPE